MSAFQCCFVFILFMAAFAERLGTSVVFGLRLKTKGIWPLKLDKFFLESKLDKLMKKVEAVNQAKRAYVNSTASTGWRERNVPYSRTERVQSGILQDVEFGLLAYGATGEFDRAYSAARDYEKKIAPELLVDEFKKEVPEWHLHLFQNYAVLSWSLDVAKLEFDVAHTLSSDKKVSEDKAVSLAGDYKDLVKLIEKALKKFGRSRLNIALIDQSLNLLRIARANLQELKPKVKYLLERVYKPFVNPNSYFYIDLD